MKQYIKIIMVEIKNNNNRYTISGSQSIKDINSYTFK